MLPSIRKKIGQTAFLTLLSIALVHPHAQAKTKSSASQTHPPQASDFNKFVDKNSKTIKAIGIVGGSALALAGYRYSSTNTQDDTLISVFNGNFGGLMMNYREMKELQFLYDDAENQDLTSANAEKAHNKT
ncbi:MAG: hypothetical protein AAF380_02630, partial [Bacteroidota bacterium]